jgi:formylglycine-generating enzyme required for sulfatase activity
MVWLPAGSFTMGVSRADEVRQGVPQDLAGRSLPLREVTFKTAFAVGKYPVTRGEFRAFVEETGYRTEETCYVYHVSDGHRVYEEAPGYSWREPGIPQTDRHPVVCVNWSDANAYIDWLSRKTGKRYRLLSEAEYEYAARAGTRTLFFWGDDRDQGCAFANLPDLARGRTLKDLPLTREFRVQCDDGYAFTSPVGSFRPNPFGLFDMLGNIWEWVDDCWNPDLNNIPADGSAAQFGACDAHPTIGGSYGNTPYFTHAGARTMKDYDYRANSYGFRVALSP